MSNPLATKRGINMFVRILAAQHTWSKATTVQRRIIREQAAPVIAEIRAATKRGEESGRWARPYVGGMARTRESMRRKGLVDGEDRLTVEAIEAAMFCAKRDVMDVELPEETQ